MASYGETKALALRELDECRELLAKAPQWDVPTVCEGWDVDALACHLAAVTWQQAEAFHRSRILATEAPSWLEIAGDRDAVLAALDEDRTHLADALVRTVDEDRIVPLPFAPLPASIAAAALVLEYGVHHADLQRTLHGSPAARLDPFVARTIAGLLPALVPILVEKPPVAPVTYRLRADTATVAVTYEGNAWRV